MHIGLSVEELTAGHQPVRRVVVCNDESTLGCIRLIADRGVRTEPTRVGLAPKQGVRLLLPWKRLPAIRLIRFIEYDPERR